MVRFGVCIGIEQVNLAEQAGADYIEAGVQSLLRPLDESWNPPVDPAALPLPVCALNVFLPSDLKVTGPEADLERLETYAGRAFRRARCMGASVIAFGAGGARNVPPGWPRESGEEQLVEAMRLIGPLAQAEGITVAMEPLRRAETNILNSVAEGLELIARAGTPGIAILCDFYHMAQENEPLEHLNEAADLLVHGHMADPETRGPPGPGEVNYRPFFAKLKEIGYGGRISLECQWNEVKSQLGPTLKFLRREWEAA
ncbi:MAG TPA: sugar phosphate isomerase/epimerase family protein [Phycisphaerae bacterium]|nr:sugar phosphate isomerase/epimerase family protein [Phycisphaerae bacterium]